MENLPKIKVRAKKAVERAALALPYTTDQRVHDCIDVTRRWCEGNATDEELRDAADAAAWAARAAAWAAAWSARAAAWAAAWSARTAAWAARYAADTAGAGAAEAAYHAEGSTAKAEMQQRTAEVVRQYITLDMLVNPK